MSDLVRTPNGTFVDRVTAEAAGLIEPEFKAAAPKRAASKSKSAASKRATSQGRKA